MGRDKRTVSGRNVKEHMSSTCQAAISRRRVSTLANAGAPIWLFRRELIHPVMENVL